MQRRSQWIHGCAHVLASLACLLVIMFAHPQTVYARDYSITQVDVKITVEQDGSILVDEARTFSFEGSFNGVYWLLPISQNSETGALMTPQVISACAEKDDQIETILSAEQSNLTNNYYTTEQESDCIRLKIYSAQADTDTTFRITYRVSGVVVNWNDTAELYWKYVSDGWDVESQNVTCQVVFAGQGSDSMQPGENVRAFGHGPLDGEVGFTDAHTITFTNPGIGSSEFAEMRILFPTSWTPYANSVSEDHLQSVLNEEQGFAEQANEYRQEARQEVERQVQSQTFLTSTLPLVSGLILMLLAYLQYRKIKRELTPNFQDKYFRDVPTDDHPAVLGSLMNNGAMPEVKELVATYMNLVDEKYLRLTIERGKKHFLRKTKDKIFLQPNEMFPFSSMKVGSTPARHRAERTVQRESLNHRIDEAALTLLFDGSDNAITSFYNQVSVDFDDFKDRCDYNTKQSAKNFLEQYDAWKDAVSSEDGVSKYYTRKTYLLPTCLSWAAAALLVVALFGTLVLMPENPSPFQMALFVIDAVLVLVSLWVALSLKYMPLISLNKEGREIGAKLQALKNWLSDFTHLEEAIPTDVILWKRLLIMAVCLGVADKVIEQLKVELPEILTAEEIAPIYGWYVWPENSFVTSPISSLQESLDGAHSISTGALAQSTFSSFTGDGGGFSMGGGAGGGGGGGGGAF